MPDRLFLTSFDHAVSRFREDCEDIFFSLQTREQRERFAAQTQFCQRMRNAGDRYIEANDVALMPVGNEFSKDVV